jgi:multidrug efflux system membrane fusion protein
MIKKFKDLPTNYKSALVIFIAIVLWIASGIFKSDNNIAEVENAESEKIISVRATDIVAKDKIYFLTIRGRTEAENKVILRPKTTSTILDTIDKGQAVKKGDVVCTLDPEDRSARLDEAIANEKQAQLKFNAIESLAKEGYRSDNAVASAEAVLKGAIARREIAENALNNTKLQAPFDGFVEDINVKVGDLISPSQMCGSVIQLDPMIVTGEVTEKNITQIIPKQKVSIELLDGRSVEGQISYISKSSNSATRTYKIEATFDNKDGLIREGVTATVKAPLKELKAQLIPSYLLSLNDVGDLGVKIVEGNIVRFVKIQIIEDVSEGIWVIGLPEKTKIITVGQEYVIDGQTVNVQTVGA